MLKGTVSPAVTRVANGVAQQLVQPQSVHGRDKRGVQRAGWGSVRSCKCYKLLCDVSSGLSAGIARGRGTCHHHIVQAVRQESPRHHLGVFGRSSLRKKCSLTPVLLTLDGCTQWPIFDLGRIHLDP